MKARRDAAGANERLTAAPHNPTFGRIAQKGDGAVLRLAAIVGSIILLAPIALAIVASLAGIPVGGALVALLLAAFWVKGEAATTNWVIAYNAPFYYYSLDPAPVTIRLSHNRAEPGPHTELRIPRSHIIFANGYLPKDTNRRLPDTIATDHVGLAVTLPDGTALSTHIADVTRQQRRGIEAAERSLRPAHVRADIGFIAPGAPYGAEPHTAMFVRGAEKVGTFEGLDELKKSYTEQRLFPGREGEDEFFLMTCPGAPDAAYRCTAYTRLRADLSAKIVFADFRVHGGRAGANDRIRTLRQHLCRFYEPPCS